MALTNASVGRHITADNFDYRKRGKKIRYIISDEIIGRQDITRKNVLRSMHSGLKTAPIFHFLLTSIYRPFYFFSSCAFLAFPLAPAIFLAVAIQISHELPTAVKEPFAKCPKGPHFMRAWHRCILSARSDFLNPNCPVIWFARSETIVTHFSWFLLCFTKHERQEKKL